MNHSQHIAKHFREVYFGGNWTWSNFKDNLEGVSWEQATTQVHSLNTIAALVYHTNYYVTVIMKVLEGGPLSGSDKYSFACPPIQSKQDWDQLLQKSFDDAEKFASLLEQLPENKIWEIFPGEKYGDYYRNLNGLIEHTHYHLGQIVIIKKVISLA